MANTSILIKRSSTHVKPTSLLAGELGYSYVSNTIFIGTADGSATLNVGGVYYTSQIDAATSANTAGAIVRRDSNNGFSGELYGNAETATKLLNGRNFSIDGEDVSSTTVGFDGTGAVVLQGNLKVTGVTSGTYGGQTNIPVFQVDNKGRITSAANVSISTTLGIAGDSGTDSIALATDTLTFVGGVGITSAVDAGNNKVTFDVDNTVIRANTASLNQTIDGNVTISGSFTVLGTQTVVDSTTIKIHDPLLLLANNNTHDVLDIGTVGQYSTDGGSTILNTGIFRHAGDKKYYVFDGYTGDITANTVNPADGSFNLAQLNANIQAPYANVTTAFTTGSSSSATFNGTVDIENDLTLNGTTTIRNAYGIQFNNSDESAYANIYNDGATGQNLLLIDSQNAQISGNLTIDKTLTVTEDANFQMEIYAPNIANAITGNLVYFDTANGRFTYADSATLTPHQIANGVYSMWISGSDGQVVAPGRMIVAESVGTVGGGYSFSLDGDTGMYSPNDGQLDFYSDNVKMVGMSHGANTVTFHGESLVLAYGARIADTIGNAVAFGNGAGATSQGSGAVAIGSSAGSDSQGINAVAIGNGSGYQQGDYSIAFGHNAGAKSVSALGQYAIAIGAYAGYASGAPNSIVLNASGSQLNASESGLYINPIRYTESQDATYDGIMFYNQNTKEVRYSYTLDGGSF